MALKKSGNYEVPGSFAIPDELRRDLQAIAELVQSVAQRHSGDGIALLALLRVLEASHRQICDSLFQDALPESRQHLYSFLRDMESQGGWPYIPRMKLRSLIESLEPALQDELDYLLNHSNRPTS